jgi:hypothetical protein
MTDSVTSQSVGAGMFFGGGFSESSVFLFILGSNLGGVGPERGLRGCLSSATFRAKIDLRVNRP